MDQFARTVLGYHGCSTPESVAFARSLFAGNAEIGDWEPSSNEYDWLGRGIYFWEHGPHRAREWANEEGMVIGAVIQIGRCFDLTDINNTALLREAYENVVTLYESKSWKLPENKGRDLKLRNLDCIVLNHFLDTMDAALAESVSESFRYQTVRCPFEEGTEAFPGSMLRTQTHIQIAVRDPDCILGVFRPNLSVGAHE